MGDIVRKLLSNSFVLFVIFIVIAIIIPLPSWLLDFMILLNISLSLIILVMTMFIKEALEFSVFPTVLLLTTVLRLSLNVSTTRGILSSGYAGEVISAFGNFVMGGDAIVGFLIFIIIVLVNFIVITKGSERVSEVAARFTLDAMPGKQMAIDADLNAGIINEEQAKKRRSNIQREADFYGSMDGATKFVKGDAIMSIVTTLVNLIGGVIIGMVRGGGDFNTILNTYSLATVGDGLCSQIPALLISVATGMIVTRAASEDSLINDLKSQFTAQPFVLMIAGIVMVVMMVIPGFPTVVCLILGVLLILAAFLLNRNKKKMAELELAQRKKAEEKEMEKLPADNDYYRDIDNVFKLLNVEPIEMEFGYSLLRLVDEKSGGNFIERVVIFRKQFALDMGMVIPSVRMTDNPEINPNMYIIKIKGEEVARGEILVDHYLALDSGDVTQQIEGIDTVEPAFGLPAKWISEDKKIMADVAGYTLIDPVSVMITHWSEIMKRYAHELLSRQDVSTMLDNVKKTNPIVVDDIIPKVISVGYLQKILANLLKEGIPIRDLETILETIGDHSNVLKDTDIITEYVRQSLKRTITHRFAEANSLRVITLDTQIEDLIVSSVKKSDQGSYLAMPPDMIQRIVTASNREIDKIKDVIPTVIVLTSPVVRIYYKKLTEQFIPNITVLSYSEIDSTAQIQAIGNISLNTAAAPAV
ncbi:MAG TPA: flagellar biosynthesis protein FlhA [Ruminococcaceae bacterium]|jgi:flagellar biosynthesis protein FlhA|nr:flagellar biosynthesis protein FlhA [Eubacterium sp. CAG:115]HBM31882.1 flagellar biosynthesis protein FlhA [Oscillospiraceae bacterium]HCK49810.1 flagellar biosynthesis protein FlhA [Oscillospiraceae bacterium]